MTRVLSFGALLLCAQAKLNDIKEGSARWKSNQEYDFYGDCIGVTKAFGYGKHRYI